MENMDKLFGIPWLAWIILAVAMIVTVIATEYIKPLFDKKKIRIHGILIFWVVGLIIFAGLSLIGWMSFGPAPCVVYIVVGGALNIAYFNDFLKLRTILKKLVAGEIPIPDLPENK
jgi:hypothetical protein